MVGAGPYILSVALLAVLTLSLGFSAVRLRRCLLPAWEGAPAHLVDAIVGVALLIWLAETLGILGLLYAGTLAAAAVFLAAFVASSAGGGGEGGVRPGEAANTPLPPDRTRGQVAMCLVAVGVVALVFAHWGLTTADALSRGMFNFDSLWYHMPFAVEVAQSHSVTELFYPETVYNNWAFPQNSELLHAVAILLTDRDTLSLFLNFGWLAIAFLAAWCIGRPYGMGALCVVAAAIALDSNTLVVREPGAAKNDVMVAALLLAAVAILVNAWSTGRRGAIGPRVLSRGGGVVRAMGSSPASRAPVRDPDRGEKKQDAAPPRHPPPAPPAGGAGLPVGWPLAAAGLAVGLAVGAKLTALAVAGALTVAVVALAPAGRRWAAVGWWSLPALAGGGYWYLRNLVVAGNPIPRVESLGPIPLPHPERLQSARPDFSIAHYATDTAIWREYFGPGLDHALGALWPLVVGGAILGALLVLWQRQDRLLRWLGGVALFSLLAYVFTPFSAAGAEGDPVGFSINIRYAIPALLAGIVLLPVAASRWFAPQAASSAGGGGEGPRGGAASSFSPQEPPRRAPQLRGEKPSAAPGSLPPDRTRGRAVWALIASLLVVLVVTNRADAVLRDPDRLFAWAIALLFVLIPAALLYARHRGAPRGTLVAGFAALALAVAALGYPLQRDYLDDRFANRDPETSIPGMSLDSAYRWAREVEGSRIGLAGTTAGFLQYGFYGADLSNRVRYLGHKGPHGAFNAIPSCAEFRTAVNHAELDYLVTAPFLNFVEPGQPVTSPESRWLRGELAVRPVDREGQVTVWRIDGRLSPRGCDPVNTPLRRIPRQPE